MYWWLFDINNGWNVRRFLEFPFSRWKFSFLDRIRGGGGGGDLVSRYGNLNSESIHTRDLINGNSGKK